MKTFDIKKAQKGAKLCTTEGLSARIVCWDAKGDYPIVALITLEDGEEIADFYNTDGLSANNSRDDLYILEGKDKGWINIYRNNSDKITVDGVFKTKQDAINDSQDYTNYIDTIQIKWEE